MRTLAEASRIGIDRTIVRWSSAGARPAHLLPASGDQVFGQTAKDFGFLDRVLDLRGCPEEHHRAIIHGMMEGRPRQHQAIDQGDRQARFRSRRQRLHHPAGSRTVQTDGLADPDVVGRNHQRLSVDHEADVTDQSFIKDPVDGGAIVNPTAGEALQGGAFGPISRIHDIFPREKELIELKKSYEELFE